MPQRFPAMLKIVRLHLLLVSFHQKNMHCLDVDFDVMCTDASSNRQDLEGPCLALVP